MIDLFEDFGSPKLNREEIRNLLQKRLRTCWWGHRRDPRIKLTGAEVGNYEGGKGENFTHEYTKAEKCSVASHRKIE